MSVKIPLAFLLPLLLKALFWAVSAQIPGLPIILGSLCGWALFILSVPSQKLMTPPEKLN